MGCNHFFDFCHILAAYFAFNTKVKNYVDPESNQRSRYIFLYYSPPLYHLSYLLQYKPSVWGIRLANRLSVVNLCQFMISEEQLFSWVCSSCFFPQYCFLVSCVFFPEKWPFRWREFEPRTYRYLLSTHTSALPNGLSPVTYAFCLGNVFDERNLCDQLVLVREFDRRAGLLCWLNSFLSFFSQHGSLFFFYHKSEKLRRPWIETGT